MKEATKYGKSVKYRLIENGMTASELAKEIGTSPQYLSKMLLGEKPVHKYQDKIEAALSKKNKPL